jgi:hypothetical protein
MVVLITSPATVRCHVTRDPNTNMLCDVPLLLCFLATPEPVKVIEPTVIAALNTLFKGCRFKVVVLLAPHPLSCA